MVMRLENGNAGLVRMRPACGRHLLFTQTANGYIIRSSHLYAYMLQRTLEPHYDAFVTLGFPTRSVCLFASPTMPFPQPPSFPKPPARTTAQTPVGSANGVSQSPRGAPQQEPSKRSNATFARPPPSPRTPHTPRQQQRPAQSTMMPPIVPSLTPQQHQTPVHAQQQQPLSHLPTAGQGLPSRLLQAAAAAASGSQQQPMMQHPSIPPPTSMQAPHSMPNMQPPSLHPPHMPPNRPPPPNGYYQQAPPLPPQPPSMQATHQQTMPPAMQPPNGYAAPPPSRYPGAPSHPPQQHQQSSFPPNMEQQQHQSQRFAPPTAATPPQSPYTARTITTYPTQSPRSPMTYQPSILDSSQLPRPPPVVPTPFDPSAVFTTSDSQHLVPPVQPVCTSMHQNAPPTLLRSTLYALPRTRSTWHNAGDVNIGICAMPLAIPTNIDGFGGVAAVVQHLPPPRCQSCHSYATPRTICLCGNSLHVTALAVQEYYVDGPYMTRLQPVQQTVLLALDMSHMVRRSLDYVQTVIPQILRQTSLTRVGLCLVSTNGILIINDESRYVVMTDVTHDPFCPLPLDEWTGTPSECLERWQKIDWSQVLAYHSFQNTSTSTESYGGAALSCMIQGLQTVGGRVVWLCSQRSNAGAGALPHREAAPKEKVRMYLDNDAKYYHDLARVCQQHSIACDVVVHPHHSHGAFGDVAVWSRLCRATTGQLLVIQDESNWQQQIIQGLTQAWNNVRGVDGVFKVRCSSGLQVQDWPYVSGHKATGELGESAELELPSISSDTCIGVSLEHRVGGIPKQATHAYVQTALLYTNLQGQRVVRVATLGIRVTDSVDEVYRCMDMPALSVHLIRTSLETLLLHGDRSDGKVTLDPRSKARDYLFYKCVEILLKYRQKTTAVAAPAMQFILPDRLRLLPLLCMSALKGTLLAPSVPKRLPGHGNQAVMMPLGDARAYLHYAIGRYMRPENYLQYLYPTVYAVHDYQVPENGASATPPVSLQPSMKALQDNGVYLIDGGLALYVYIGSKVSPERQQEIRHGVPESSLVIALNHLVGLRQPSAVPVIKVFQQEGHQGVGEAAVLSLMMDDASMGEKDYGTFMTNLQGRMQDGLMRTKK